MNNHKKLYWFMTTMTFISIILFAISPIYAEKLNTWMPMILMGCLMTIMLVLTIIIYIKYVKFICPKCNQDFKASAIAIILGIHTPTRRLLRCPHCNAKSWCKEDIE